MSERIFRLILGATLILLLYLQLDMLVYGYIGIMLFEGITNLRTPLIISRIRYGDHYFGHDIFSPGCSRIPFDAERMLRIVVALLLVGSFVLLPEETWFFPWFIGFMLFMAGITNICPMVMALRWIGFK